MATILAVDDEQPILELIKNGLQKDGHMVTGYVSAEQVPLNHLNRYDLIILDIMMPGIDGFSFCEKIRSMVDCPILFLTAKTMENDITFGLGLGADDYLTKPFRIPELRARVNAHIRREQRERHSSLNFERIKIDLSSKTVRLQLDPLYEATSEVAKQNLDFEVGHSNIKEFEDVLLSFSRMKESLKASLEQQWEAEHMQKEQIAALAHDLKTPLTVIQGNADLISETELDEEQRLYAEYISSSSEQMQLYIQMLIDLSRAATGYQLHMEDIAVLAYVEQLLGQIDALCQTKKIGLQMELEHLPDVLSADKLLLERAIMNVINNALDYSPQDSSIHISIIGGKQHLKITVTDAGPGFLQEDLLHAEEQFYMADHSRSSNLHFGMGLFITKSIVQQHGGQLDLSNSEKTGGAQVTISIPY